MSPTSRRAAAACVVLLCASGAHATVVKMRTTIFNNKKIDLIETVKLSGDLRLRHETMNKKSGTDKARQRQRFRLRFGADVGLPYDLTVGLKLASGVGEQASANQSFDNTSGQKAIWINHAFLQWKPKVSDDGSFYLTGGKMKNPLWRVTSSDAIYDKDWNPEGLGEGIEWFLPSLGGIYFVNAMQVPVDEDSGSEADQWLFAQQLGAEYRLPFKSRLRIAGAYHEWVNERQSTFGQPKDHEGNREDVNGVLINEFGVASVTGQLSTWVAGKQLRLQGTYLNNVAAMHSMLPRRNEGYQVGGILGEAKLAKSWEFGYFYKFLETDATVADLADSDFGDGGTNRRGHIGWVAYNVLDWIQLKGKFFYTKVVAESLPPNIDDINRTQLDMVVKF